MAAGCLADLPSEATRCVADLPAEVLFMVALRLPTPSDTQHLFCQTSAALRRRLAGWADDLPAAWLLHNHPRTALTRAAHRGDAALLAALLAAPGTRPDPGDALAAAARAGHMEAVQVLLSSATAHGGADANEALAEAAAAGHLDVVRVLMSAGGADPFAADGEAVRRAYAALRVDVLKQLLGCEGEGVALVAEQLRRGGMCMAPAVPPDVLEPVGLLLHPFTAAARRGDVITQGHTVAEWGPEWSQRGEQTWSAWIGDRWFQLLCAAAAAAAAAGRRETVSCLLAAVDEDVEEQLVFDAVGAAAGHGQCGVLQDLLPRLAHHPDAMGDGLRYAAAHGQAGTVELLLAAGAQVTAGPVTEAARGGHVGVLGLLLDAAEEVQEAMRDRALAAAAVEGQANTVRVLLGAGASACRMSPAVLAEAVRRGQREVLRMVGEAGADVEAAAMVAAAERGDRDGVQAYLASRTAAGTAAGASAIGAAGAARRCGGGHADSAVAAALAAALEAAGNAGHADVVEMVLRAGARADGLGTWRWDWLITGGRTVDIEIMELMLGAGARVHWGTMVWLVAGERDLDRRQSLARLLLGAVEAGTERERALGGALLRLGRSEQEEAAAALRAVAAQMGMDGV